MLTGHEIGICIIYSPIFALNKVIFVTNRTKLSVPRQKKIMFYLSCMQARSLYWMWCNKICVPWNNSRKCLYIKLPLWAAHKNKHRMPLTNVVQFPQLMNLMNWFVGWTFQQDELLVWISLTNTLLNQIVQIQCLTHLIASIIFGSQ